jgi:hypothetical protein
MLRFLRIRHLAVIDAVDVDFDAGLNVLPVRRVPASRSWWRPSACSSGGELRATS